MTLPLNLVELADPHATSTSAVSPDPAAAIAALGLRQASWSEVGPDAFFLVVNAVVALFAAAVVFCGALPEGAPPAGAPAAAFAPLVASVLAVNWAIMLAAYGGYHWLFFGGGYRALTGAAPSKFNPAPLEPGQLRREVTFTTLAMGIASAYHIAAIVGRSRGWWLTAALPATSAEWAVFLGLFPLLGLASDAHFWVVHRAMHIPAVYSVVHRLHHLSRNPGPWSGMSMHPIESAVVRARACACACARPRARAQSPLLRGSHAFP
jgi:hypothetical protein